jgi:hypothetical protein
VVRLDTSAVTSLKGEPRRISTLADDVAQEAEQAQDQRPARRSRPPDLGQSSTCTSPHPASMGLQNGSGLGHRLCLPAFFRPTLMVSDAPWFCGRGKGRCRRRSGPVRRAQVRGFPAGVMVDRKNPGRSSGPRSRPGRLRRYGRVPALRACGPLCMSGVGDCNGSPYANQRLSNAPGLLPPRVEPLVSRRSPRRQSSAVPAGVIPPPRRGCAGCATGGSA